MHSTIRKELQKVYWIFFLLSFIAVPISQAQVISGDTLSVELDEIQVEATHSSITVGEAPMSLTYMIRNSADLASKPSATMDELTYTMPGIFISNRENYALGERLTIRGLGWRTQFGVRGTQVILDGMPLTVADGQTIMNMIDPAAVKRIELLRGPAGTFWGNSSGGVLYLSTEPQPDAPTLQYRGYGGSFSTVKQELELNSSIGRTRIYGYGTYFETNGYRDHSAARLYRGSLGLERPVSDNGNFSVRVAYTGMPKAQHPGSLTKEDSQDIPQNATPSFVENKAGKTIDQAMIGTSYIHQFSSGILDISAHGTYRDVQNPLTFGVINLERYAGGVRSTYQFNELPFDLQVGGELKIQDDDRLETNNVNGEPGNEISLEQQEQVTNQALFSRISIPISDQFSVSAGARADWLMYKTPNSLDNEAEGSRDFFSFNPSFGLLYDLANSSIFANFSTSFESPTTTELVNRPTGGSGFNQSIEPEKTLSLETGIRGRNNSFSYDFAVYGMKVEDILVPIELENGPVYFQNEGQTNHYGIEIGLAYNTTANIDFRLMLNYLQAKFDGGNYDGNDLPGVAPFRAGAAVDFTPGNHQFSLDSEWISSYYADSENSAENSAYALLHFRWTVRVPQLFEEGTIRPFIAVNNLFNTRYNSSVFVNAFGNRYFEPGSSRNFRAGLQLSLF
ncbi:TonB-dependent receptor family protein [Rhodohalobacter sulfatireducens]|uniref:TonB-dependent receptor n=1 Tax=Rhodohalobacter sulfatireducens TaxID=2911366 RepID=A0ABS9KGU9_9BACT|nr:TonB-dependent receptor [Rhodohalobacter sulfatireducens]MCG2590068.1 TonB-dependent receptor [Rhodohalobacter sulfatireducens]